MGVQVVHDEPDGVGPGILFAHESFHETCKVSLFSPPCHFRTPLAPFGLHGHENVPRSVTRIIVILSGYSAAEGVFDMPEQLLAFFVKTDHRFFGVVRLSIQVKKIMHPFRILRCHLPDAPHFFQPGLNSVFFNIRRTVSLLMVLHPFVSERIFSVKSSRVHRSLPSGASLQAMAVSSV